MTLDLPKLLHRYVDDCGYSWPLTVQVVNRMLGSNYTQEQLRALYRKINVSNLDTEKAAPFWCSRGSGYIFVETCCIFDPALLCCPYQYLSCL